MDRIDKLVEASDHCIRAWEDKGRTLDVKECLVRWARDNDLKEDVDGFVAEVKSLVEAELAMRRIGERAKEVLSNEQLEALRKLPDTPEYRGLPSEARSFTPALRYGWQSMFMRPRRTPSTKGRSASSPKSGRSRRKR